MDPGVRGALRHCAADHSRRPSDPRGVVGPILAIVYLAAWRDSWQLIGEVKTRLGHAKSTVDSVASFANCRFCLNAGLD